MGDTPCISCGGWDGRDVFEAMNQARYDGFVFARGFVSNPDLPERLRHGWALQAYARSRFYGPWESREKGYVDYPSWVSEELRNNALPP